MASLQKIRNHGAALIVIVGLAMLAFIMGDFLNSGSSFFNRNRENVATIAGHDVHYTEYENAKSQLEEVYKIEFGMNSLSEEAAAEVRSNVWQTLVLDYTLRAEGKKLGMSVTNDELSELCIGQNPHQMIASRRAFYDPATGQFSRENLIGFLSSLEQAEDNAQLQEAKNYWLYWEKMVRISYMQEKYASLLHSLVGANSLDAKYAFDARQISVNADYIYLPYNQVADSLVKVSESDVKNLYKKYKSTYKQEPNRNLAYVVFPVVPSEDDYQQTERLMQNVEEEFRTTDDVALVVNTNSDLMYDGRDYSENTIPARYKEFAFHKGAKVGDFMPLSFEDNVYAMARIMECGYSKADSVELKALATEEGQEDAELGWFKASDLPKQIAEPAFAGKRGTRFTVSMGQGEQQFEILEISPATPKVKVAILEREVTPSSKTYSILYNQAKKFIVENNNADAMLAAARENGMNVIPALNVQAMNENINGLKSSRPIVRWAFEAKQNQVSDVFECGESFVVAALTEVNDSEYRTLDQVRSALENEAKNNAKAKLLMADLKGVESLEDAAKAKNVEVKNVVNLSLMTRQFGGRPGEYSVIGTAVAQAQGETSAPIQGKSGVYMVKTLSKTVAEGEMDMEQEKSRLGQTYSRSIVSGLMQTLTDKANIKDNRINFQ